MTSVTIARPVSCPRGRQHLEAQLFVPLEAVGTGARLVGAAAQAGCPHGLELAGERHDLLFAFDRARAGDHGDARAADLQPARLDHGPLALQLGRGSLVRSHDRQDLFDALAGSSTSVRPGRSSPRARDDRLVCSVNHLGRQPQRGDVTRHVLDLCGCRVRFHDHDHGRPSSNRVR